MRQMVQEAERVQVNAAKAEPGFFDKVSAFFGAASSAASPSSDAYSSPGYAAPPPMPKVHPLFEQALNIFHHVIVLLISRVRSTSTWWHSNSATWRRMPTKFTPVWFHTFFFSLDHMYLYLSLIYSVRVFLSAVQVIPSSAARARP